MRNAAILLILSSRLILSLTGKRHGYDLASFS